jgi:hypothetical protein
VSGRTGCSPSTDAVFGPAILSVLMFRDARLRQYVSGPQVARVLPEEKKAFCELLDDVRHVMRQFDLPLNVGCSSVEVKCYSLKYLRCGVDISTSSVWSRINSVSL